MKFIDELIEYDPYWVFKLLRWFRLPQERHEWHDDEVFEYLRSEKDYSDLELKVAFIDKYEDIYDDMQFFKLKEVDGVDRVLITSKCPFCNHEDKTEMSAQEYVDLPIKRQFKKVCSECNESYRVNNCK